jgi:O-antigen ligase
MSNLIYNTRSFIAENMIGLYLLLFMIPFQPKWYSLTIVILFLEQLIRKPQIDKKLVLKKLNLRNAGIWLILFYFMHFIGLLYSENISFGWMDIGMKASFIVFPLYFLLFSVKINWNYVINAFLIGLFLSILINFSFSLVQFLSSKDVSNFFQAELSHLMHRSYWATFLSMGYFFLWYKFIYQERNRFYSLIGVLILFILTLMTGAKIGLLLLLFITITIIVLWIKISKRKWSILLTILGLFAALFIVNLKFPQLYQRAKLTVNTILIPMEYRDLTSFESTTARILMWDTSVDLIQENFWLGVGTGDVKDELQRKNFEKGFTGVAEKNYNSHNQLLNTHVAIGFFGVLFLFLAFLIPILFTKSNNRFIQLIIILILFFSLLPESFLEAQAGIIPTAFFLSFIGSNWVFKAGD